MVGENDDMIFLRGVWAFLYLCILIMVAGKDCKTKKIENRYHIIMICLGMVSLWLYPEYNMMDRLIGTVIVSIPMLIVTIIVSGAFGGGDIKLMAVNGFLLGWKSVINAMVMGVFSAGIYCVYMLMIHKINRKDRFSFGPFLALGLSVTLYNRF